MSKKTIMITGASSGIGEACAFVFATGAYRLILTGRREKRLAELKTQLESRHQTPVMPLPMDVRNQQSVERAIGTLNGPWKDIDILVNNAGLALGLSGIEEGNTSDWDQMIDTNLKGLLYVSKAVIPLMMARQSGHIIHIGSIAGRETYPKGNVYCATKHAVASLARGMRMDLLPYGIKVTEISPGATETEFSLVRFSGDKEKADKVYDGFTPLRGEDVALAVRFAATLPPHVNVHDMLLMPSAQASATVIRRHPS